MTESPAKKIYRVTPPKAIKNWKKRVSGRFFSADREGWF